MVVHSSVLLVPVPSQDKLGRVVSGRAFFAKSNIKNEISIADWVQLGLLTIASGAVGQEHATGNYATVG